MLHLFKIYFIPSASAAAQKPVKNSSYNMLCSDVYASEIQVSFLPGNSQALLNGSKMEHEIKNFPPLNVSRKL